ncbi:MAG TPA: ABC transporter substrate-binding protein [Burkholderiales bacterium]|nr:ABC transporter substrate-binding protein [Burkholderiales bacterium]
MKKIPTSEATREARRQFLKLSAMFTAAGALPLLQTYNQAIAAEPDAPLRIGYLPITDATALLVAHHNGLFQKQGLEVEKPRLFRSWAQIVEAFLAGQVNAVHLLSPMTVWARYGSKSQAKVVAWNHMSGSGLTVLPEIDSVAELGGKTVAIPFWYSIHNVVLQHLFRGEGLESISDGTPNAKQVKLVVMAPSDMVPALATRQIAGYIVAEPFNAQAEVLKVGKILRFTGDVWRDHACCVVLMHENDLNRRPEWTQKVVNGIVQAQAWIRTHRKETAQILSRDNAQRYTPHTYEALEHVLAPEEKMYAHYASSGAIRHPQWKDERISFQPYPYPSYTETLVKMLQKTVVLGNSEFLKTLDPAFAARDLVDDRFVKKAIADLGGMKVFGQAEAYTRTETITA